MPDIILAATQRCGSTMVVEDMQNVGVLGQPEEWFLPWSPEKPGINWTERLAGLRRRATGQNGVMAVKVMADQLQNVEGCLSTVVHPCETGDFPHFAAAFRDALWVRISRRDLVLQAISREMSRQTGINHATASADVPHFAGNLMKGYDPAYNEETVYDYDAISDRVTSIRAESRIWDHFFESHNIDPIQLVYEEVAADPQMAHIDRMATEIGLPRTWSRIPRRMTKMGNARNAEWRARFFRDAAERGSAGDHRTGP